MQSTYCHCNIAQEAVTLVWVGCDSTTKVYWLGLDRLGALVSKRVTQRLVLQLRCTLFHFEALETFPFIVILHRKLLESFESVYWLGLDMLGALICKPVIPILAFQFWIHFVTPLLNNIHSNASFQHTSQLRKQYWWAKSCN